VSNSRRGDQPLHRKAMMDMLRGDKRNGKVRTPGICAARPEAVHAARPAADRPVISDLTRHGS
jgi:hypothetical protein